MESLKEKLNSRARFVAGSEAYFRDDNDPKVASAVRDAEAFIVSLPSDIKAPGPWAGTTADPETILGLSWWIAGYPEFKSVGVLLKGDEKWMAYWSEPAIGISHQQEGNSIAELLQLDIPGKLRELIKNSQEPPQSVLVA